MKSFHPSLKIAGLVLVILGLMGVISGNVPRWSGWVVLALGAILMFGGYSIGTKKQ